MIAAEISDDEIPEKLTRDFLEQENPYGSSLHKYFRSSNIKNQITGRALRLRETSHSPGDLYLKVLSEDEIEHLATRSDRLRKEWDPKLHITKDLEGNDAQMELSNIIYIRVYGAHDVILATLFYTWMFGDVAEQDCNMDH
jgi:hypothetical protein